MVLQLHVYGFDKVGYRFAGLGLLSSVVAKQTERYPSVPCACLRLHAFGARYLYATHVCSRSVFILL
jgi:hypothetical protein